MKTTFIFKTIILAGLICLAGYSCKKTEKSEPVDKTDLVSTNVKQYNFGEQNLIPSFTQLTVNTTKDTVDNSAWLVYLYAQNLDRWYVVPGYGIGATTNYRLSFGFKDNKLTVYIDKIGPGEKYEKARLVRFYSKNKQTIARLKEDPNMGTQLLPPLTP